MITTWEQNLEKCCSLDMTPIIFSSADEQKCVSNFTKGNWTGNWNYWTGGFQGCRGRWGWCNGATFVPISENLTWAYNQPEVKNTTENCLHMRIFKNDSSTALSDRNCRDKYIYACKAKTEKSEQVQVTQCSTECQKDLSVFTDNNTIKDPYTRGDWYTACGRHWFLPNVTLTWSEAWDYCCSYDMKLAAIDTPTRHACLTKLFKESEFVVNVEHWTSAKEGGIEGIFNWCNGVDNLPIQEINWKGGKPNLADGKCVFVQFSNRTANRTTFSLGDCTMKRNFLCEKKMDMSDGDIMQRECMYLHGVSYADLQNWKIDKFTNVNSTTRIKCFIKCMGELNGLLLFGKLGLSLEALQVVERSSRSPEELQTNFGIIDECGNPTTPDDECSRAAGMYECGQKKAPAITTAIQDQLIADKSKSPVTIYTYPNKISDRRYCRTKDLPCNVNPVLRQELMDTGSTAMGSWYNASNGKRYFRSVIYLPDTLSYIMAFDYCCSLGMRIPEFATYEDFQVVKAVESNTVFFIAETFLDGQERDIWCNSNMPITDKKMYYGDVRPADPNDGASSATLCLLAYFNGSTAKLKLYGDLCGLYALSWKKMSFMCE